MLTVLVADIVRDKILVSRESAREIEAAMVDARAAAPPQSGEADSAAVTFDLAGIAGVSPSFVDELVRVFEAFVGSDSPCRPQRMIVKNPPTRLSSKFEAIARSHAAALQALPDGSWLWTSSSIE